MIKQIVMDLGGVYFQAGNHNLYEKIKHIVKKPKIICDEFFEGYPKKEGYKYRNGKITKHEFWNSLKQKLQLSEVEANLVREIWFSSYAPIPGMKDLVQNLRKIYKVTAFSGNIEERVDYLNEKYQLNLDFDDYIYSFQYGCSKLGIEFFHIMRDKLSYVPEEVLYIDDIEDFTKVGRDLGLNTIHFTNFHQLLIDLKTNGVEVLTTSSS